MDLDRLREIVAAIPPGAWMSYGDVARAAGGSDRQARTLNQRFIRECMPGAHRVLKADGSVGPTALGDGADGPATAGGRGRRVRRRPREPGGAAPSAPAATRPRAVTRRRRPAGSATTPRRRRPPEARTGRPTCRTAL